MRDFACRARHLPLEAFFDSDISRRAELVELHAEVARRGTCLLPWTTFCSDPSTMTRPSWVAPRAWLSFIELDKAVVLV